MAFATRPLGLAASHRLAPRTRHGLGLQRRWDPSDQISRAKVRVDGCGVVAHAMIHTRASTDAANLLPLLLGQSDSTGRTLGGESLSVVNRLVSRLLLQQQTFLSRAKEAYQEPGSTSVTYTNALKFASVSCARPLPLRCVPMLWCSQEFKIVPQLCTEGEFRAIYLAVNTGEDVDDDIESMDQMEFNEFLVRLAILHCPEYVSPFTTCALARSCHALRVLSVCVRPCRCVYACV